MTVVGMQQYAAASSSVRAARQDAAGAIHGYGLDDTTDIVTLLVSELVTNAVKASRSDNDQIIALRLTRTPSSLVIEVWDSSDTPPVLTAQDDPDAEGGRGLLLVETLSTKWGHYHPLTGGKVVWCAVELPSASTLPPVLEAQAALDRREPAASRVAHPGGRHDVDPVEFFTALEVLRRVVVGLRTLDWELPRTPPIAVAGHDPHLPRPRRGRTSRSLVPMTPAYADPVQGRKVETNEPAPPGKNVWTCRYLWPVHSQATPSTALTIQPE